MRYDEDVWVVVLVDGTAVEVEAASVQIDCGCIVLTRIGEVVAAFGCHRWTSVRRKSEVPA